VTNRFRLALLPVSLLSLQIAALGAQRADPNSSRLVHAMGEALLSTAHLPGLSLAVGKQGKVILTDGFGFADIATQQRVTAATQFRTASVGKVIAATALGKLLQDGRINLDASVQEYVPAYPAKQWTITPRQLAGHIAGVPHYNAADKLERRFYPSLGDALGVFAAESLRFEPGTRYAYSTHGYTLLSAAIEGAAGKPFLQYLDEAVLRPLGMKGTGPNLIATPGPTMATLYSIVNNKPLKVEHPEDPSYKWAGGGMISTPSDLVRLTTGYYNGFLKPATVALMFASQRLRSGVETGVALGWRNSFDFFGHRVVEHAGSMEGARSVVSFFPESQLTVAIMSNTSWNSLIEETAHMLALPFLLERSPAPQPEGSATVNVRLLKNDGSYDDKPGVLVLQGGAGRLTVDPGTSTEQGFPLVYLERGNRYAMVRPDGIVLLTIERSSTTSITGLAIRYNSPRLTPPTDELPFLLFAGPLPVVK
jgi:serine beta-lactamase-like protein LACTB, mitochondrial